MKENFKLEKEFEIKPGIIVSKLNVKNGDTLIITVDIDIWDIEEIQHMMNLFRKWFPNNNIICTLKGFDITIEKSAGAESSPK